MATLKSRIDKALGRQDSGCGTREHVRLPFLSSTASMGKPGAVGRQAGRREPNGRADHQPPPHTMQDMAGLCVRLRPLGEMDPLQRVWQKPSMEVRRMRTQGPWSLRLCYVALMTSVLLTGCAEGTHLFDNNQGVHQSVAVPGAVSPSCLPHISRFCPVNLSVESIGHGIRP
jgi:hypothetical protein